MKLRLPGRRSADDTAPDPSTDLTEQLVKSGGKGRPTPKRSEAQGRRQGPPPPPPTTRKEAYRRMRETQAVNRVSNRQAAARGDERALPARDQGPVRQLVRDVVDTRHNVGSLFLLIALLAVVSLVVPNVAIRSYVSLVMFAFFIVFIGDSLLLSRKIKRELEEKLPKENHRGASWYGISRSTMVRRWRFPKPRPDLNT